MTSYAIRDDYNSGPSKGGSPSFYGSGPSKGGSPSFYSPMSQGYGGFGYSPYSMGGSYGSPYTNPYSVNPYGGFQQSMYGGGYSPYGGGYSRYGGGFGSATGKGGGFGQPLPGYYTRNIMEPELPPRDTTGLTPMGGGNSLADGINDGTIAMQPGDEIPVPVADVFPPQTQDEQERSNDVLNTFREQGRPPLPTDINYVADVFPEQTQGGQQGRLSQAAVLGGMDPASDQITGFPTPPPPPPPTTIADDFRPYYHAQVGPVRPPMRQAMPYGGKGGYYR